ncbi:hypothetical protein D3C73_1001230 [compost metagenome]
MAQVWTTQYYCPMRAYGFAKSNNACKYAMAKVELLYQTFTHLAKNTGGMSFIYN